MFEHSRGHHRHKTNVADPALLKELETILCDECQKNCSLADPKCGRGWRKVDEYVQNHS